MVRGDPGETTRNTTSCGCSATAGHAFTYIVSDVIYLAGDVNQYEDKFLPDRSLLV